MPVPTSVLSSSHHKIAEYDAKAFLPASFDVGGRALTPKTGVQSRSSSIVSLIILAVLMCAIAILAIAAADADTLPMTDHDVILRYSGKIAFWVAPVRQFDNIADAAFARLMVWENQRMHLGIGTSQHFVAPIFSTVAPIGRSDCLVWTNQRNEVRGERGLIKSVPHTYC